MSCCRCEGGCERESYGKELCAWCIRDGCKPHRPRTQEGDPMTDMTESELAAAWGPKKFEDKGSTTEKDAEAAERHRGLENYDPRDERPDHEETRP